jgi:CheY-like chemotaxis protein
MPRKILVVEDYDDSRLLMKFMLESHGYEVDEARDGREALESCENYPPDLILMDMSMPVMDRLTATRFIRKLGCGEEIPIIAVTAHGSQYYRRAIEAGCNDLISKPVDFDSLNPLIDQYLRP